MTAPKMRKLPANRASSASISIPPPWQRRIWKVIRCCKKIYRIKKGAAAESENSAAALLNLLCRSVQGRHFQCDESELDHVVQAVFHGIIPQAGYSVVFFYDKVDAFESCAMKMWLFFCGCIQTVCTQFRLLIAGIHNANGQCVLFGISYNGHFNAALLRLNGGFQRVGSKVFEQTCDAGGIHKGEIGFPDIVLKLNIVVPARITKA